jgi:glycosyltransferase involved in cell wall biosynthesis
LRILHWAFPFTLAKGGQSVFIERISVEFSNLGHEVGIITSEMESSEVIELDLHFKNLVKVFQLPTTDVALRGDFRTYGQLKNAIDGFAPDVIHLHNLESPMLVYLRSYLNMTTKRPKVIITVHDLSTLRKLKKLEQQSLGLHNFFDAIVFPSKFMYDTFAPIETGEKPIFITIYNGVPGKLNIKTMNPIPPSQLLRLSRLTKS